MKNISGTLESLYLPYSLVHVLILFLLQAEARHSPQEFQYLGKKLPHYLCNVPEIYSVPHVFSQIQNEPKKVSIKSFKKYMYFLDICNAMLESCLLATSKLSHREIVVLKDGAKHSYFLRLRSLSVPLLVMAQDTYPMFESIFRELVL